VYRYKTFGGIIDIRMMEIWTKYLLKFRSCGWHGMPEFKQHNSEEETAIVPKFASSVEG